MVRAHSAAVDFKDLESAGSMIQRKLSMPPQFGGPPNKGKNSFGVGDAGIYSFLQK
jgi:hypothetical protein